MCGGSAFADFVGDSFEKGLDLMTNYMTFGTAGYSKEEKFKKDGYVKKGVKDVMGVTAAEEANELTRQQIAEAKNAAAKEQDMLRQENAANQISASRQAGAVRSRSGSGSNVGVSSVNQLGGVERDFLGL